MNDTCVNGLQSLLPLLRATDSKSVAGESSKGGPVRPFHEAVEVKP